MKSQYMNLQDKRKQNPGTREIIRPAKISDIRIIQLTEYKMDAPCILIIYETKMRARRKIYMNI